MLKKLFQGVVVTLTALFCIAGVVYGTQNYYVGNDGTMHSKKYNLGDDTYNIQVFGDSLADANRIINGARKRLIIDKVIIADGNVPSNIDIEVTSGGRIDPQSIGDDLYIRGNFTAGNYTCFGDPNNDWVHFDEGSVKSTPCEWYGGNGLDSNGDSKYIRRAINSLESGDVTPIQGTYLLDTQVTLKSNVNLVGNNKAILKLADGANCNMFYGLYLSNITIKNLVIDGNKLNNTRTLVGWPIQDCSFIILAGCDHIRVLHNTIENTHTVLQAYAYGTGHTTHDLQISNNYFHNNGTMTGEMAGSGADIDVQARGVVISDNVSYRDPNNTTGVSIYIEPPRDVIDESEPYDPNWIDLPDWVPGTEIVINGNTIRGASQGITINHGSCGVSIIGNTIANVASGGIYATQGTKEIVIIGNTIRNATNEPADSAADPFHNTGAGIYVASTADSPSMGVTLANNIIEYCWDGIYISNGGRYTITGNNCSFNKASGICLDEVDSGIVSNNFLYNNYTNKDTAKLFGYNSGIILTSCSNLSITNNQTVDTRGYQSRCVYMYNTNNRDIRLFGNTGIGTTEIIGGTSAEYYTENIFSQAGLSLDAQPAVGTWLTGTIVFNSSLVGKAFAWICTASGTFSSATDSTGDTDGSTSIITGLTDTSDFFPNQYVTVSAGFSGSPNFRYKILAKTVTTITIDDNSNAVASNVTIATPDPTFTEIGYTPFTKSNASVSSSGAGEDTLSSTTITAGYLGTTGGVKIKAAGTKTGEAGNKTIKLHFGASSWTVCAAANNTNDWRVEAEICNTAAGAQRISWVGWDGATPLQGYETASIDTTAAVTLKLTGECADAGDTVTQTMWLVERY